MEGLSPDLRATAAALEPGTATEPFQGLRELRALLNLSYSLHMVRRLPRYAGVDAMPELPRAVRQASRDALFIHSRLVAEFFGKLASSDDNARLFLPSWTPPADVAERLRTRWDQAMIFVAPMSRRRPAAPLIEPDHVDLSVRSLEQIAVDCDAAVRSFVEACESADIELLPEVLTLLDVTAD